MAFHNPVTRQQERLTGLDRVDGDRRQRLSQHIHCNSLQLTDSRSVDRIEWRRTPLEGGRARRFLDGRRLIETSDREADDAGEISLPPMAFLTGSTLQQCCKFQSSDPHRAHDHVRSRLGNFTDELWYS